MSFVDRTNAGFAALTMNRDLGFSSVVFGFGAGIFFIGYSLFQVPANVILERIGARRWIFCIMAAWGLLSATKRAGTDTGQFLRGAISLGRSGGRVSPRHASLYDVLVSKGPSGAFHRLFHDRQSFIGRRGWANLQPHSGNGRRGGATRLAMAVPAGRIAHSPPFFRRAQIPARRSGVRLLAHEGRERNHRNEPGDRGTGWPARLVVRLARPARTCAWDCLFRLEWRRFRNHIVAAADREGDGLFQYRHRLCRRVVLCGVYSHDDLRRAVEFKKERAHLACIAPPFLLRLMCRHR